MAARRIRGWWWVDFRVQFVRYRKKCPANSKGSAEAYERFLRGKLAERGSLDHIFRPPAKPITFAEFAERWMREYVAVNNKWSEQRSKLKIMDAYLLPAFGSVALREITAERIEHLKSRLLRSPSAQRKTGIQPKTINNILTVLRKCLATAVEWSEIDRLPPVRRLRVRPSAFRFLRDEEAAALLSATTPGPWRTMILVALKTGLRYSELAGLLWEDIDMDRRTIAVRRGKVLGRIDAPKNGRERHLPITSDVVEALAALPRDGGVVFGHVDTYRQAGRAIGNFADAAELPGIGWHTLRHTYASRLVAAGVPIRAVQDLLGHASIQMTMRYAHLGQQELRSAVAVLEPGRMGTRWASAPSGTCRHEDGHASNAAQQSQNHRVQAVVSDDCGGGI
jgi:integrase